MSNMSDYGIRHQREKLFDDFELMWRSGDRPDLEAFVRSNLGAENEKVLRELICIDLDYRLQGNEVPRFEEYSNLLPNNHKLVDEAFRDAFVRASLTQPPKIPRFNVMDRIGVGGQGEVWLAHDPKVDRLVAIKIVRSSQKQSPKAIEKIRREARITALLQHPNVVPVYDTATK